MGRELVKKVQEFNKKDQRISRIQTFSIRRSSDQQLFLKFPDGFELGYLSEKLAHALKNLVDQPSVEFEAVANLVLLDEAIHRAEKAADAAMRVNINVYGKASDRDKIGKELSDKGVFLQAPDHYRPGMKYDNPHILRFDGMDESNTDEESEIDNEVSLEPPSSQDEEFDETIADVFSSLRRGQGLNRLEGSNKLKVNLFP